MPCAADQIAKVTVCGSARAKNPELMHAATAAPLHGFSKDVIEFVPTGSRSPLFHRGVAIVRGAFHGELNVRRDLGAQRRERIVGVACCRAHHVVEFGDDSCDDRVQQRLHVGEVEIDRHGADADRVGDGSRGDL